MDMLTLTVGLQAATYEIEIGAGAIDGLASAVTGRHSCTKLAIVTDETVWALHGTAMEAALRPLALPWETIVLPPGEGSKSQEMLAAIYSRLAQMQAGRDDILIAFGGGVVGDISGFAAATWMRGIHYLQVPTTLLAQVDSSVGGKTAINIPAGKNLVGAFYQPQKVLVDIEMLATLPPRDRSSGWAEIIKYGAILSEPLFCRLQGDVSAPGELVSIIAECCRLKSRIVEEDERDTGRRMLLNFGHTFGHGIELLGGFQDFTHGEAVAVGMVLAARVGEALGRTPHGCADRLRQTLQAFSLPTQCPYPLESLLEAMRGDKKNEGQTFRLILLEGIGSACIHRIAYDELLPLMMGMETDIGG